MHSTLIVGYILTVHYFCRKIGTKYTILLNKSYLSTGIHYLHSVTIIRMPDRSRQSLKISYMAIVYCYTSYGQSNWANCVSPHALFLQAWSELWILTSCKISLNSKSPLPVCRSSDMHSPDVMGLSTEELITGKMTSAMIQHKTNNHSNNAM